MHRISQQQERADLHGVATANRHLAFYSCAVHVDTVGRTGVLDENGTIQFAHPGVVIRDLQTVESDVDVCCSSDCYRCVPVERMHHDWSLPTGAGHSLADRLRTGW